MKYIDLIGKIEKKEDRIITKNNLFKDYKNIYKNSNIRSFENAISYLKSNNIISEVVEDEYYAVTKEIIQVVYAPGSVVRMSVAVAVNKVLTEAEKDEIRSLVQAAAGIDVSRGDVVSVSSLKFTGIDNSEELKEDKARQQEFIMEILTFIFKNVSPVLIILLLGLVALNNFGNIFRTPKPKEEELEAMEDMPDNLPSFDPYLMLQHLLICFFPALLYRQILFIFSRHCLCCCF